MFNIQNKGATNSLIKRPQQQLLKLNRKHMHVTIKLKTPTCELSELSLVQSSNLSKIYDLQRETN